MTGEYVVGWDLFYVDNGNKPITNQCKICGENLHFKQEEGPRTFIEAMQRKTTLNDVYFCPHTGTDWHNQASSLYKEMKDTSSPSLYEIIAKDLEVVVDNRQVLLKKLKVKSQEIDYTKISAPLAAALESNRSLKSTKI